MISVPLAEFNMNDAANDKPFTLFAGPCMMESVDLVQHVSGHLHEVTSALGIPFVFKASYDKANRSSALSERGPGLDAGYRMFDALDPDIPCMTDVHNWAEATSIRDVVDILQIPAFLCRQLDLLDVAIASGLSVNIKKGQWCTPNWWHTVVENAEYFHDKNGLEGPTRIFLTDRGTSLGPSLAVDMKSLAHARHTGYPVVMDITHSMQVPAGLSETGGGGFYEDIARGALGMGIAGIFLETHPNPSRAKSDKATQIPLSKVESLLARLKAFDDAVKGVLNVQM